MRGVDYVLFSMFTVVYLLLGLGLVGLIFQQIAVPGVTFVFELAGIVIAFISSVGLAEWTVKKIKRYYRLNGMV